METEIHELQNILVHTHASNVYRLRGWYFRAMILVIAKGSNTHVIYERQSYMHMLDNYYEFLKGTRKPTQFIYLTPLFFILFSIEHLLAELPSLSFQAQQKENSMISKKILFLEFDIKQHNGKVMQKELVHHFVSLIILF